MPFPRKCPSQKGRHSQGDALHTEGVQYFSQERMPDKNKKRHSHGGPSQGRIHLPWFFSWEWREKRALFVFHTSPKEKCQTNKERHSHGGPSQGHIHLPWFFFGNGERKKRTLEFPQENKTRQKQETPLPWRAISGAHSPSMVFSWEWGEKKSALCFSHFRLPQREKCQTNKIRHSHGGPSQGHIHLPWFSPGNGERKKRTSFFNESDGNRSTSSPTRTSPRTNPTDNPGAPRSSGYSPVQGA